MKKYFIWYLIFPIFFFLFSAASIEKSSLYAKENWWDKFGEPQYGGTITYATAGLMGVNFDVYSFIGADHNFHLEALFEPDWTLDRNIWSFSGEFAPEQYAKGNLAESWEIKDSKTVIVHIRKGIHWQKKAPVNGREFTAYDVQKHYDRILGTGSGYSWKAPMYAGMTSNWEKVTATDKYTLVFKFRQPSGQLLATISDRFALNVIEPPEWVALGGPPTPPSASEAAGPPPPGEGAGGPPPPPKFSGPLQDWHKLVGTGPWMLEKYVDGSSFTWVKNPDYWGTDPRHPKNRLPYADKLTLLIVPDLSTRIAALRTKKIDTLNSNDAIEWQQIRSLNKSNPDLQKAKVPLGTPGLGFRMDKKPFTDVRVRKALNMAIDRKAIAKNIYGGTNDGIPAGLITQQYKGYAFDYSKWPQDLKDGYNYNPAGAKKLLSEAGYPNGFKTNAVISSALAQQVELTQVFKSYFKEIGVDMDIRLMDSVAIQAFTRAGKHDQMSNQGGGATFSPTRTVDLYYSKGQDAITYGLKNPGDKKYDALRNKFWSTPDPAKAAEVFQQLDRHAAEQYWGVYAGEVYNFNTWQPYLKGYSGENLHWGENITWSRLWIDKKSKK